MMNITSYQGRSWQLRDVHETSPMRRQSNRVSTAPGHSGPKVSSYLGHGNASKGISGEISDILISLCLFQHFQDCNFIVVGNYFWQINQFLYFHQKVYVIQKFLLKKTEPVSSKNLLVDTYQLNELTKTWATWGSVLFCLWAIL